MLSIIKQSGRKVLIWGASCKTDGILSMLEKHKIQIAGYIDKQAKKIKEYNNYSCYDRDIVGDDEYFVYIGLQGFYEDIIEYLKSYGYEEFKTFLYPSRQCKIHNCSAYSDAYGNLWKSGGSCIGILSNGSKIIIGKNCSISNSTEINACNGSEVIIGNDAIIDDCIIESSNNSKVIIGDRCDLKSNTSISSNYGSTINFGHDFINYGQCIIDAGHSSIIEIGNNCSGAEHTYIVATYSNISIEDDCMISRFVTIRSGNGHNLFDIEKLENINLKANRDVKIKKHVWLGMFSTIMSGAVIGSGSMVGAHSMVIKEYPNNSCIVGIPGKVIKRIAWKRDTEKLFESYSDFEEFDFTDK